MPERHGYKIDGGWASGADNINGNSIPQQITLDNRTDNTPAEYKASNFIEFVDGFVSSASDEFFAYIATGSNIAAGNTIGSGGEFNVYRYGFNGKENDREFNSDNYDFGARIYDGRLGRWLSLDPLQAKHPHESPYMFVGNNPIFYADLDGRDKVTRIYLMDSRGHKILLKTITNTKIQSTVNFNGHHYRADINENIYFDISGNKTSEQKKVAKGNEISVGDALWTDFKNSDLVTGVVDFLFEEGNTQSKGAGSSQEAGFIMTGNSDGKSIDFIDKSNHVFASLDLGDLLSAANNANFDLEDLFKKFDGNALKNTLTFLEKNKTILEGKENVSNLFDKIYEQVKTQMKSEGNDNKISPEKSIISPVTSKKLPSSTLYKRLDNGPGGEKKGRTYTYKYGTDSTVGPPKAGKKPNSEDTFYIRNKKN